MSYNNDFINILDKLTAHYRVKGEFMKSRAYEKARDSLILYDKDIELLTLFVTEQGKILPRRATGVTVQQQRKLAKAIKRARMLSLFSFVASNSI